MKRSIVICVALLAACADREADQLEAVRDAVCACKTVRCAEVALERVPPKAIESSPRSTRIAREMLSCLAELYELDRPTFDPDAPANEPP